MNIIMNPLLQYLIATLTQIAYVLEPILINQSILQNEQHYFPWITQGDVPPYSHN